MYQGQLAGGVQVRVGIEIGGGSVGGPTGVADSGMALHRLGPASLGQLLDSAALFPNLDALAIQDRQASGVITPIFQSPQGIKEDRLGVPWANICDNSAHRALVLHFYVDRVNV
jgi:hypothetical protein